MHSLPRHANTVELLHLKSKSPFLRVLSMQVSSMMNIDTMYDVNVSHGYKTSETNIKTT